jgi:glycosyltransferase involved in cell wall biosynthesis
MERQPRPASVPGSFTMDAVAALRAVAWAEEPLLLAAHPSYLTNPYQSLLYSAAWEEGIAPVRMPRQAQLEELRTLQSSGIPTALHLHWLHPVQRDAASDADARGLGAAFVRELDDYIGRGGRLVWTVHNVLPHETRFEAAEIALTAAVVERAHVIHVLTAGTPALVAPYYRLPEDRILHVPHPSYRGAYADPVSRQEARHELGIRGDEFVVVALGAIRPYKGLDELLDAWQDVPVDRPRRLVIAGAPADVPGVDALIERAAVDPKVLIDARQIPAEEIQHFLRAADVAVLPYRRALNSGALMLALTFGVPVIVPDGGGLAEVVDDGFARTFRVGDRASLARALTDAPELATDEARRLAGEAAAKLDPMDLSRQFARGLRAHLATAEPAAVGVAG